MDPSGSNSGQHDSDGDPLRQLEDWGRQVDRRVRRAQAGRRAGRGLVRGLTWPGRVIRRRPGVTALVVLVVLCGVGVWIDRGSWSDWTAAGGARPYPTQTHPAGVFATSTATADPAGPFAGTPAARWAQGEAGIAMPPAAAVKGFTAAEVATNLAGVRAAMLAARLDHRMLIDHDPSAFLKLVAPGARGHLSDEFRAGRLLSLVTVIDAGARLSDLAPRVSGRTSYASAKDTHGSTILEIVTNYVWAYPFDNDEVTLVHDEVHWRVYRSGDVRPADRGLWVGGYDGYYYNIDCAAVQRGLLAPPRSEVSSGSGTPDPEDPANFYDPDHTLDIGGTCEDPTPSPSAVIRV